jgi:hypothetical protein
MRKIGTLISLLVASSWSAIAVAQGTPADMPPAAVEGGGDLPDVVGHIGVGYFTTTAPLGVRYWFREGQGIDAGIGLNINKPPVQDVPGASADTQTTVGFEFGYLHSLAQSRNLDLFVRPGVGILNTDTSSSKAFGVNINGSLCGEMFLAGLGLPHVSLTAGLGLAIQILAPDGYKTGFGFSFYNSGTSIVSSSALIGAHFYF